MGKKKPVIEEKVQVPSSSEDEDINASTSEDADESEEEEGESSEASESESNEESESESDSDNESFVEQEDSETESLNEISDQGGSDEDEDEVDAKGESITRAKEQQASTRRFTRSQTKSAGAPLPRGFSGPQTLLAKHMDTDDLSSDDEAGERNTIGRVPLHWYDAYDHIGYDIQGAKIGKSKGKDRMDQAIANRDDPAARRTVYDMYNDQEVVLSERDMEIIRRMQAGAFAHPEHDDTPDYDDYFSSIIEEMPISGAPEPKRNFIASKWEEMRVVKIAKAIKEGRYKTLAQVRAEKKALLLNNENDKDGLGNYQMWADAAEDILKESALMHLPAPKMPLPGHAESYNPPAEYLLSAEEQKAEDERAAVDKKLSYTPKAHACLRHVSGYENFIRERFERCLDLYLCPRKLKKRLNIDPETLLPRLPRPRELKPFPNTLCLQYLGHRSAVRAISISPDGQYLASCSDDGTVRLWEIDTCLCRNVWKLGAPVVAIAWNPQASHSILAAATAQKLVIIAAGTGDKDSTDVTEALLTAADEHAALNGKGDGEAESSDEDEDDKGEAEDEAWDPSISQRVCKWQTVKKSVAADKVDAEAYVSRHGAKVGPRLELLLQGSVTQLAWHHKGDYIATLTPSRGAKAVCIHQLSKAKTQSPFKKSPGAVQSISFHPSRPFFFVATQQQVKVFDLVAQKLMKKLLTNCKWVSCISVHGSGDHILVGSYDRRVVWFDLDLGSTPYKTLKYHEKAVRAVAFHPRYPLMSSASDDGTIHIFHATVYSDLERSPMIVPLKVLRGHKSGTSSTMGATTLAFHPFQPWIASAGADGVINLFQDL
jgi:ribosome biogenesis protein ERB1